MLLNSCVGEDPDMKDLERQVGRYVYQLLLQKTGGY